MTDDCFAKDVDTEFASNIRSATDFTMQVQVLGETALQGPVCPISLCREFLCFVSVLRSVDFLCIFVPFFFTELFFK